MSVPPLTDSRVRSGAAALENAYLVRMRRGWIYLAVVLAVGLATGLWFVTTEEVDQAATEPAAFELFLWVYTVTAMAITLVLCLVAEIVARIVRRRGGSSA
jgi:hypothetical protein